MKCAKCQSTEVKVLESRKVMDEMYRRRGCMTCRHTWITKEITLETVPAYVTRVMRSGFGDKLHEHKSGVTAKPLKVSKTAADYMKGWIRREPNNDS